MSCWACCFAPPIGVAQEPSNPLRTADPASASSHAHEHPGVDQRLGVVVVRPASWSNALQQWKAYREEQGHTIHELDCEAEPANIQAAIAAIERASQRQPLAKRIGQVVLIGDVGNQANQALTTLPTWHKASSAMVKFGGDAYLATDNPYADLDGDNSPDVAVGRIPADSADALQRYLARVIAYEQNLDYGMWRRDVRVVAGVGGFGMLADSAIEMTTSRFLTDRVPAWCDVSMTYASPNSPYCPDPFRFSETTLEQFNAGSQFWVYIGHGHVKHLDYVKVEDQFLCILEDSQVPQAKVAARPPIAMFLACYTGAFDAREDCLSEKLLMSDHGPIAVVSASRVSGPYGLASLASHMLQECYVHETETLGQVLQHAKQNMLKPDPPMDSPEAKRDSQMQLITALASALSPAGHDLLAERLEHVWQVNLLGDPLVRLNHPQPIELNVPPKTQVGQKLEVRGRTTQPGKLVIELAWPRDRTVPDSFTAGTFTKDAATREKMHASYQKANNRVINSQSLEQTEAGEFRCEFDSSSLAPGRYVIRAFAQCPADCAAGAVEIQVVRPR